MVALPSSPGPSAENSDFLEVRVGDRGAPDVRGVQELALGYLAGGASQPYGWRWDGSTLRIRSDRYGFSPLYWNQDGDVLRVSTSVPRLLEQGASPALDDDAMAVFLRRGFFLGDDTPFLGIRAVPPSSTIIWDQGKVTVQSMEVHVSATDYGGVDDVIDGYVDLFRSAMSGVPWDPDMCVLPLSGGKDSRHIFLELFASGRAPRSVVTFEQLPWQEPNLDVTLAAELARVAGVQHRILKQPSDPVATEVAKDLLCNLCSDEHAHMMALMPIISTGGLLILDGIAGDVLSESKVRDTSWSQQLAGGQVAAVAERELGTATYLDQMLQPEFSRRWNRERALTRLQREMARHADAPNPFGSYRFWNRARREIALAPLAMLGSGNTICLPYLYPPLFDFLAGLPAPLLSQQRIHTAAMRRAYPEFAGVPFDHERSLPVAQSFRPTRRVVSTAKERVHSVRWLTGSARYGLANSEWLRASAVMGMVLRGMVQPRFSALPWMPRMLVFVGVLERLARGASTAP